MADPLKRCTITPAGDGYRLHLEAETGATFEVDATFEQLDLVAEEIDRLLDDAEETALASTGDEG